MQGHTVKNLMSRMIKLQTYRAGGGQKALRSKSPMFLLAPGEVQMYLAGQSENILK